MDNENPFPLTKNTFKDITFLRGLNRVPVHSQTEKYVELFLHLVMVRKNMPGFTNSIKGVGEKYPVPVEGWGWKMLVRTRNFFLGENHPRSDFDHLNLFQS